MSNETACEWLRNKGFSITDIDFVESVLTFTSTAKSLPNKLNEINQTLKISFPDKEVEIVPHLTFQQLEEILHHNGLFVDLHEMLTKYKGQGICVNLCHQLLESQYNK